jgi:hypothetical protein
MHTREVGFFLRSRFSTCNFRRKNKLQHQLIQLKTSRVSF